MFFVGLTLLLIAAFGAGVITGYIRAQQDIKEDTPSASHNSASKSASPICPICKGSGSNGWEDAFGLKHKCLICNGTGKQLA